MKNVKKFQIKLLNLNKKVQDKVFKIFKKAYT